MLLSIALLPIIHYLADFELQTDWMALNKSKEPIALFVHVMVYSLCFFIIFGWQFGLITFATHWATDWITSRMTSKLWFFQDAGMGGDDPKVWPYKPLYSCVEGRRHRFFCVIGLDQMIHTYCLLGTVLITGAEPFSWLG